MKITPKHTGVFNVNGVGRVWPRSRRSRNRHHWIIQEDLGGPKSVQQPDGTLATMWSECRDDFGQFRTKYEAIKFMREAAVASGGRMEGDMSGYPRLIVPLGGAS